MDCYSVILKGREKVEPAFGGWWELMLSSKLLKDTVLLVNSSGSREVKLVLRRRLERPGCYPPPKRERGQGMAPQA